MKTQEIERVVANKIADHWYNEIHGKTAPIFSKQKLRDFAEAELKKLHIPLIGNWVAVKEQLPPDETEKYIVLRDGEIEFDKWIFDGNKGYWWDYMGITHWMHIPKPPCC